ncbi:MAG: DNA polymerase I [Clostridia bacterium]|nr:DNA polymerase I [Clostridia bacterium]
MKLLVLDGNSILNRAFYGIKLLTTKDGRFTNGIYGFLSILIRLRDECAPDGIAAAFDLRVPTFRHKLYDVYKAGRKPMPEELAQQMPVLKELLSALGFAVVQQEGYEADDILGTFARLCEQDDDWQCFIATGDRDSLQLVSPETTVMLASTKAGRPITTRYTPEKVLEDYGVSPKQLIDVKALMGDSSDNIPGVAGVGQKTAGDLIARFGSIDAIYADLDTIDVKNGVREKLRAGKESAYLSRTLGTICREAPIDPQLDHYLYQTPDVRKVTRMLADLEMFSMIERLQLPAVEIPPSDERPRRTVEAQDAYDYDAVLADLRKAGHAYFDCAYDGGYIERMLLWAGETVLTLTCGSMMFPAFMRAMLEDGSIRKHVTDSKPLYAYARRNGFTAVAVEDDLMLTGYILNPSAKDYGAARLAQEYGVPLPEAKDADVAAAAVLPQLFDTMLRQIVENGQEKLLREIELPLASVLADMEISGFAVDADGVERFGERLDARIRDVTASVFSSIGFEFNLNSPKQLGEALFEKLGLPAPKKTKNGYSTNAETLQSLAEDYPVVEQILEYRTLQKLKSTYCDGMLKAISPDGRIHSTLNQTETRTGRISSTEPNLQNIPVRSELGKEMRRFFRAKEGFVLVDADYSQIELRVLAALAKDEAMLAAFNAGVDIHTVTASQVFNMPQEMVTPLMRSRAKAVNFGIVYGIGAFSLAKDIGVPRYEADSYIKGYLRHYSGVAQYLEQIVRDAKDKGYAETVFGRRRYLPELASSNHNLRAFGERVAKNMPIQGTAADVIKIAMVRVHDRLRREGYAARLILQVHDELIVEAPENEADAVARLLSEEMERAANLGVKLPADVHMGQTWYDAKG